MIIRKIFSIHLFSFAKHFKSFPVKRKRGEQEYILCMSSVIWDEIQMSENKYTFDVLRTFNADVKVYELPQGTVLVPILHYVM